jgi:phosphoserine phosphatase RsbU/P
MRSLFHFRDPEPAPVEPIPTVFPTIDGAQIGAVFVGKRLAGDFYDSIRVSPERVLVGLLDVAGRRDENRGILATAQKIFREAGSQLFSGSDINESNAMTELCLLLNRSLIETASGVHSCPAFIACYHEKLGTLCYTNAGHTPALLRDHTGIATLNSTGLPLGLFSHATCEAPTVGMEKDSVTLLVSRGVVECEGRGDGSTFGLEGIKTVLQNSPSHDPKELCTSILNSADEFTNHAPICDDRTALALFRSA